MAEGSGGLWRHAAYCVPQFTLMFAYTMPIALLGALTDDPVLQLDNASVNAALAAGSLMRAVGKAVNGVTVDSLGVRPFLAVILLAAAVAAGLFSMARGQTTLVLTFGLLAFCNSGAWLAGCKIIESRFRREEWGPCFSALATCSRLGSMVARMGLGALLAAFRWQTISLSAAPMILCSWAFTVQVLLREGNGSAPAHRHMDLAPPQPADEDPTSPGKTLTRSQDPRAVRIWRMLTNRGLQLQACIVAAASCQMALENMCPLLLKDLTSLGNAEISMFATVFPAGVLCGVLATPQAYARLSTAHAKLCFEVALQVMALGAILALSALSAMEPGDVHPAVFLLCLGLAAFGMALNYYIKPGMHTLEFGEDCATASSILDGAGQLASVGFQLGASAIFKRGGSWAQVMLVSAMLVALMLVSTVLLFCERAGHLHLKSGGDGGAPAWGRHARVLLPVGAIICACVFMVSQEYIRISPFHNDPHELQGQL